MSNISKIALILLAIVIGYAFIYPAFGEISLLSLEKQDYEDSLATVRNIENRKNELVAEYNSISVEDKQTLDTVLPDNYNFVRLVSQIDAVASKYSISITDITSEEITDPSVGETVALAQPEKKYQSGIVGFSFDATYENFKKFTTELEKSLRILDLRTVRIEAKERGEYAFEVELETYWLK